MKPPFWCCLALFGFALGSFCRFVSRHFSPILSMTTHAFSRHFSSSLSSTHGLHSGASVCVAHLYTSHEPDDLLTYGNLEGHFHAGFGDHDKATIAVSSIFEACIIKRGLHFGCHELVGLLKEGIGNFVQT